MREKKNIDRLFQEKFKNFEASPDNSVWDKINTSLHAGEKDKKPIPLWYKVAGIAALLMLSIAVGSYLWNDSDPSTKGLPDFVDVKVIDSSKSNSPDTNSKELNNTVVDKSKEQLDNSSSDSNNNQPERTNPENFNEEVVITESERSNVGAEMIDVAGASKSNLTDATSNSSSKNSSTISKTTSATTGVVQNENKKNPDGTKTSSGYSAPNSSNITATKESSELNLAEAYVTVALPQLNELRPIFMLEESEAISDLNKKEDVETLNRWNVAPMISPVYFNTLGQGSSIDSQFNENSKSGDINFSYGITGSYALNDRLRVRAGVNKLNLGYSTNEVIVYRNTDATVNGSARLRNIRFKDTEINTSFISATNISYAVIPDAIANNIKGSIDQELGFIEVPVELEYGILDKKVGINVIGGFSALFLDKNEVYSTLQGDRRLIGEATNINNTSYSANLGLGFSFKFSESLDLNLEPTFKYQLNTFEDSTGDFQPYFIGVYSGLKFKF